MSGDPHQTFLRQLQALSKSRADRWHAETPPWSLLEWAGAMCGESGEAANIAKKIKRLDTGMWNNVPASTVAPAQQRQRLVEHMATEIADTILYGICCLNELDFDAEELLRSVFNEKSEEAGFPERL